MNLKSSSMSQALLHGLALMTDRRNPEQQQLLAASCKDVLDKMEVLYSTKTGQPLYGMEFVENELGFILVRISKSAFANINLPKLFGYYMAQIARSHLWSPNFSWDALRKEYPKAAEIGGELLQEGVHCVAETSLKGYDASQDELLLRFNFELKKYAPKGVELTINSTPWSDENGNVWQYSCSVVKKDD